MKWKNKIHQDYYNNNKEKISKQKKEYYKKNREEIINRFPHFIFSFVCL